MLHAHIYIPCFRGLREKWPIVGGSEVPRGGNLVARKLGSNDMFTFLKDGHSLFGNKN